MSEFSKNSAQHLADDWDEKWSLRVLPAAARRGTSVASDVSESTSSKRAELISLDVAPPVAAFLVSQGLMLSVLQSGSAQPEAVIDSVVDHFLTLGKPLTAIAVTALRHHKFHPRMTSFKSCMTSRA